MNNIAVHGYGKGTVNTIAPYGYWVATPEQILKIFKDLLVPLAYSKDLIVPLVIE